MLGSLLISIFILLIIWDYINKKQRNEILKKSNISTGVTLPLIGGALQYVGINPQNAMDRMSMLFKRHGKIFHTWVLQQLVIFCADPKILEAVFSSPVHITKHYVYHIMSMWLGDGLLTTSGKKWRTRRKIITPCFHFTILEGFLQIFERQTDIMIKQLSAQIKDVNKPIDIHPLVCLMSLNIIAETAMGVQINDQTNENIAYVQSVKIVIDIMSARIRKPLWCADILFKLVAPHVYQHLLKHINGIRNFNNKVIEKRRITLETEKPQEIDEALTLGGKRHMIFLDLLLQASFDGKPLSNADICEEVETFMFAGHDTTTSGSSFALYLISKHPEVQNKLFAEINEIIGNNKNQAASYTQLQNLHYMECVIKESLRLYPPVPVIGRYFKDETDLNGTAIPADCHLNIPLCVVLRDPDYFQDPNEFKLERFAAESAENIFTFAYTPFSAGPRNCIGQKYAMLEMKCIISKILRHYELLPKGPEVVPVLSLILGSENGVHMGFKTRIYKRSE